MLFLAWKVLANPSFPTCIILIHPEHRSRITSSMKPSWTTNQTRCLSSATHSSRSVLISHQISTYHFVSSSHECLHPRLQALDGKDCVQPRDCHVLGVVMMRFECVWHCILKITKKHNNSNCSYDYADIYIMLCSLQSALSAFPHLILAQPHEADNISRAETATLFLCLSDEEEMSE